MLFKHGGNSIFKAETEMGGFVKKLYLLSLKWVPTALVCFEHFRAFSIACVSSLKLTFGSEKGKRQRKRKEIVES